MSPPYPLPSKLLRKLLPAVLFRTKVNFEEESRQAMGYLNPPLQVLGVEFIPQGGPGMITVNHFSSPGFMAWWFVLAISSVVPAHIHWIMTSAWTFTSQPWLKPLAPLSRWVFQRVAQAYDFSTMPPMPPRTEDVERRAHAVRQILKLVKSTPDILVGTAPEGRDLPGGVLGMPPPGAGRFLLQLSRLGLPIIPAGYYDTSGCPFLRFGPAYDLSLPTGLSPDEADRQASLIVMKAIARQLPAQLRGNYL